MAVRLLAVWCRHAFDYGPNPNTFLDKLVGEKAVPYLDSKQRLTVAVGIVVRRVDVAPCIDFIREHGLATQPSRVVLGMVGLANQVRRHGRCAVSSCGVTECCVGVCVCVPLPGRYMLLELTAADVIPHPPLSPRGV